MDQYDFFYNTSTAEVLAAWQVKNLTSLDPATVGIEALEYIGIYPIEEQPNPHDSRFYTAVESGYTVDYVERVATTVWAPTPVDLADAKVAGVEAAREKAEAAAVALDAGFGPLTLLAAAAQNVSSRSADAQSKLVDIAGIMAALLTNIADINAAATVDDIVAILEDSARDSQALTATQQDAIDGKNASFPGTLSVTDGLGDYADDTAAAAGGVAVNQLYRNGSVVQIRVS